MRYCVLYLTLINLLHWKNISPQLLSSPQSTITFIRASIVQSYLKKNCNFGKIGSNERRFLPRRSLGRQRCDFSQLLNLCIEFLEINFWKFKNLLLKRIFIVFSHWQSDARHDEAHRLERHLNDPQRVFCCFLKNTHNYAKFIREKEKGGRNSDSRIENKSHISWKILSANI